MPYWLPMAFFFPKPSNIWPTPPTPIPHPRSDVQVGCQAAYAWTPMDSVGPLVGGVVDVLAPRKGEARGSLCPLLPAPSSIRTSPASFISGCFLRLRFGQITGRTPIIKVHMGSIR